MRTPPTPSKARSVRVVVIRGSVNPIIRPGAVPAAVPGSVVDVRRWVGEAEIPRMLVGTHYIAVPLGHEEGTGAAVHQVSESHATLPGAVRLDGSIALAGNRWSVAAGAGRRCSGDQPCGHQHASQSSDDAALHRFLPSHRRWTLLSAWVQIPSTAQPATMTLPIMRLVFAAFGAVIRSDEKWPTTPGHGCDADHVFGSLAAITSRCSMDGGWVNSSPACASTSALAAR